MGRWQAGHQAIKAGGDVTTRVCYQYRTKASCPNGKPSPHVGILSCHADQSSSQTSHPVTKTSHSVALARYSVSLISRPVTQASNPVGKSSVSSCHVNPFLIASDWISTASSMFRWGSEALTRPLGCWVHGSYVCQQDSDLFHTRRDTQGRHVYQRSSWSALDRASAQ